MTDPMTPYLTRERYWATIRQYRSSGAHRGPFLVVEGNSDWKFFSKHVLDDSSCQRICITPKSKDEKVWGKATVIDVVKYSNESSIYQKKVIGIVDSDFEKIDKTKEFDKRDYNFPNIFSTDTHDLETMVLETPALETFIKKYFDQDALSSLEKERGEACRELLLNAVKTLGLIAWYSKKYDRGLSLNRDKLRYKDLFVDEFCLEPKEIAELLEELLKQINEDRSKKNGHEKIINKQWDLKRLTSPECQKHLEDIWNICRGHDLTAILTLLLAQIPNEKSREEILSYYKFVERRQEVEKLLIKCYKPEYFKETQLFISIHEWQQENKQSILNRGLVDS